MNEKESTGANIGAGGQIRIRGARTHNLTGVDLDLPRNSLIVITGPSGSGKSSLAFDTIFAEGQRRYVESLSVAARQFVEQLPRPEVDLIEGLSPTIALEQSNRSRNPRSTVGTVTEIYDFLRLLFSRVGEVYSHKTGKRMERHSAEDMVEAVMTWPEGTRFSVIAPVINQELGDHSEKLEELRRQGYVRVAINDEVRDLSESIQLDASLRHCIDVYVDRLALKPSIRARLGDSIETALRLSGGQLKVLAVDGDELQFSEQFSDPEVGLSYPPLTPALFSFNNPDGACPRCNGIGRITKFDADRIVPNVNLSLEKGAIRAFARRGFVAVQKQIRAVASHFSIDVDKPWKNLSEEHRQLILYGSKDEFVPVRGKKNPQVFGGVIPILEQRYRDLQHSIEGEVDEEDENLEGLQEMMREVQCESCEGERLRIEARMVRVSGKNIHQLASMPIENLLEFFENLELPDDQSEVAELIAEPIKHRLSCIRQLGLGYLELDRSAMTLSGGESQRIRLATQIGSSLVGVTYVLDEPSIGLHQRDNDRLIEMLKRLRDLGNTVIVVEHDEDTMRSADYVVDMGPGAGVRGGRIVAEGKLSQVLENSRSLTAGYLSGRMAIAGPKKRRRAKQSIVINKAKGHNLQSLTVRIPVACLTCVTGVSGSGKSSLIVDTLLPEARRILNQASTYGLSHEGIDGLHAFERVISVNQSPIGRSPRSNPATYTGIFTDLRNLFAKLNESKIRGFGPARFSFNVKGGRCEACEGDGVRRVEMHFLPDVFVTCRSCHGARYNRETLSITYRGKSIAEVLELSIAEACDFFANHSKLRQKLELLRDVGLGYMALGQSSTTLSGGEAQRIKLAKELTRQGDSKTLFILDEPTTGLHVHDIRQLLGVLNRLVDDGHTVVVIEHNLDMIKSADYVLDIGPEGGVHGGRLVACGTPERIAGTPESYTGKYLASAFKTEQNN